MNHFESPPSLVVFDAYGTLFDVTEAAARHADRVGPKFLALAQSWRQKQLEYSWTRSLMRAHADFWICTEAALDWSLAAHAIEADAALRTDLLDAYRTLGPFADAAPMLAALRRAGRQLAILSNGSNAMLADAIGAAGWDGMFDAVLSIDEVGIFKPDEAVYALVERRLGVTPSATGFVSANPWDSAGAAHYGFGVVRLARIALPVEYEFAPARATVRSLAELPPLLGA